jgi:hypothetical protein
MVFCRFSKNSLKKKIKEKNTISIHTSEITQTLHSLIIYFFSSSFKLTWRSLTKKMGLLYVDLHKAVGKLPYPKG